MIILREQIMCKDLDNNRHVLKNISKEERYDDFIKFIEENKVVKAELLENGLIVCTLLKEEE